MSGLPAFETLLVERRDGVFTITLNRPEVLNALTEQMGAELGAAVALAAGDAARCVVVTGAGKGFCAGQDLRGRVDATAPLSDVLRRAYNPVILGIAGMDKPVVAAVNGVAAGAGLSLALACDVRIASDAASFVLAFNRVGLVPDAGATYVLPRVLGLGRALELAWTGERLDAGAALGWGLVNRVVPAASLAAAAHEFAAALAAGPTTALGLTKRAMRRNLAATLEEALDLEASCQEIAGSTADHREGVAAFLEKREPRFTGA